MAESSTLEEAGDREHKLALQKYKTSNTQEEDSLGQPTLSGNRGIWGTQNVLHFQQYFFP